MRKFPRFVLVLILICSCRSIREANIQGQKEDTRREIEQLAIQGRGDVRLKSLGFGVFEVQGEIPVANRPQLHNVDVVFTEKAVQIEGNLTHLIIPYPQIESVLYERNPIGIDAIDIVGFNARFKWRGLGIEHWFIIKYLPDRAQDEEKVYLLLEQDRLELFRQAIENKTGHRF